MTTIINLVMSTSSFCKSIIMLGLKIMFIVIHTWVELVTASIIVHLNLFRKTMIWIIALLSLPIRVLSALQRERLLEEHLHQMQIELDYLLRDKKELKDQLQIAIRECRILESILADVEEENDKASAKIEFLEGELQNLKVENLQLKEIQDKGCWSSKGNDDTYNGQNISTADNHGISYAIRSLKSSCEGGVVFEDLMMHKGTWDTDSKSGSELLNFLKTGSTTSGTIHPFTPEIFLRNLDMNKALDHRREVALLQSLFSAMLSLLVGMVIWEAEEPCMPLVVALFAVVGISLKGVVNFFFSIKNKPASDAVALLSFNWFVLGALAYPTLSTVAHLLAPSTFHFLYQTVSWLATSSR